MNVWGYSYEYGAMKKVFTEIFAKFFEVFAKFFEVFVLAELFQTARNLCEI